MEPRPGVARDAFYDYARRDLGVKGEAAPTRSGPRSGSKNREHRKVAVGTRRADRRRDAAAAQGRTPGFAEDDLRKIIYSSHQARHEAGLKQHLAATDPDLYGRLMLGMATSPAETAKLQALDALLASANAGKQSGLYSDFDPSAGSWTSPAD